MARTWFRLYAEFAADPKVQMLAHDDQRHFVMLLCLKCAGHADADVPSDEFRDRMIAHALGLSVDAAIEARRRLVEVGLIDEKWQPCQWDARQYEHDVSTDRVRRYREKQRAKRDETVSVTTKSRTEQSRADTDLREAGDSAGVEAFAAPRRPAARGTRIPDDFAPDLAEAVALIPDLDAPAEAAKFGDYWRARTGAGATKRDWSATWRNWIRNCAESGRYARRRTAPAADALNPHASLAMR